MGHLVEGPEAFDVVLAQVPSDGIVEIAVELFDGLPGNQQDALHGAIRADADIRQDPTEQSCAQCRRWYPCRLSVAA